MRPIKFMAWHKTEKKMYGPFTLGDLYGYEGEMNAVTLNHPYTGEGQDLVICEHSGGSIGYPQLNASNGLNPDIELIQFTGWTDKYGKEIYENYVVRLFDWEELAQVMWCDNGFYVVLIDSEDLKPQLIPHDYKGRATSLEVMGDIYQNPEWDKFS